jgi:DNA-directed RNA polymerase specialized sigma subunit
MESSRQEAGNPRSRAACARSSAAHPTHGNVRSAEKLVVALYYYENLKMREIAQVLGRSESTTRRYHVQAVRRLQESST